ncbi:MULTISPECIES: flagellar biosynthesis anti-sigma factor FlgM [Thermoanaerobacterium]|uniref:Anti-sigma-28 factor FlgM family protein n=2 Tax=Thermoanaerobacterium TaxID=28895 RepID=W9E7T3_9THEO|nr:MULTISPECIES: flagellar biosynthesis anti-sigma factor FlgM [Thermoanaerobacterium]AFK87677.1 Anti-sigma-28 factor FlgM family protein [Thermoanaerobacterium saccharolyticum JW/SL-YS485]ETO37612.1 anti-sigma-28 factor FlgM family protein [Thermoanaerobacterium aotearoense SCUT27]
MKIYNNINVNNIYDMYKSANANALKSKANKIDKVEISDNASKISKSFAEYDKLREEKVQDIKAKVDSGNYNIKCDDIAESIIKGAIFDKKV